MAHGDKSAYYQALKKIAKDKKHWLKRAVAPLIGQSVAGRPF